MKSIVTFLMLVFALQNQLIAQNNFNKTRNDNSVVMTWNKNTPEQEMKDNVKALRENNGVTIKYSNLKRNSKNEITKLKIEYSDRDGNSGSQEYNNKNAIPKIQFFKNNGDIGFGNPNNNIVNENMVFEDFGNFDLNELKKQLSTRIKIDTIGNNKSFSFNLDDKKPSIITKNKIIIQKDGRKPLVFEDGKLIDGESDYSKEEIEKIKNENKIDSVGKNQIKSFSFNLNDNDLDMGNLRDQIEKMQIQMQKMMQNSSNNVTPSAVEGQISKSSKSDKEDYTKEMKDAKEEMIKAKKALEEAQKSLPKTKSEMKTHRI